jgi:hypothetical protein
VKLLGDLVLALAESLPSGAAFRRGCASAGAGGPALGVAIEVTGVDLTLPIEAHIDRDGELRASLPRGRMATGFRTPHGRLTARFTAQGGARPRAEVA